MKRHGIEIKKVDFRVYNLSSSASKCKVFTTSWRVVGSCVRLFASGMRLSKLQPTFFSRQASVANWNCCRFGSKCWSCIFCTSLSSARYCLPDGYDIAGLKRCAQSIFLSCWNPIRIYKQVDMLSHSPSFIANAEIKLRLSLAEFQQNLADG